MLIDRKMFTPSLAFESLNSNVILARTPEFFSILDAEEELGADNEYEVDGHFYGCRSSVGRSVLSVCERSVNGGYSGHLCHL